VAALTAERKKTIPIAAYIVAAVCVAGIAFFTYLQRAPRPTYVDIPATKEAKDYVRNLRLSDVTIQANQNFTGQLVVEVEGKIENAGDRPIQSVELYCYFYNDAKQPIYRPRQAIVTNAMGGLKPGEMKSFRLPFDEIPEGWNRSMPQMQIAGIKFQN
jgi:hypothetical protein